MGNLAQTYYDSQRYSDALPLQEHVLEYRQQNLGGDHADIAVAMHYLGWTYNQIKRFTEAQELGLEAEPMRRCLYGTDHDWYQWTALLIQSCDIKLAAGLSGDGLCAYWEKVVGEWKKRVGDENIFTLKAMHELAVAYYNQGRYFDALPLTEHVLKHYREQLGSEHLVVAFAMHNRLGRLSEAQNLMVKAEIIKRNEYGIDDEI